MPAPTSPVPGHTRPAHSRRQGTSRQGTRRQGTRRQGTRRQGTTRRGTWLAVAMTAAVPLLLTAACGSGSTAGTASPSSPAAAASAGASASGSASGAAAVTYPVTVKADNGEVTIPARPTAIVSLSPTLTEMLYAIGAGGQVKAVDDQSGYPASAPRTKLSGFTPNVEAIAGYAPDLVVVSNDTKGLVAALTKLKLPVLLLGAPGTIEASYTQELALGAATGHVSEAQQTVETTRKRIAAAVASVPKGTAQGKVYHEVDQTYYSVTSSTFIGDVYRQFGLTNIADTAPQAAGGYPQLSAEYVVSAAPTLIVLADGKCCGQTPDTVAKRPAFGTIPAVRTGHVVAIDDDLASRWGPRAADFAEQVAKTLSSPAS